MDTEIFLLGGLLLAFLLTQLCERIKVPRVIGQIGAGIILGNTFLRSFVGNEAIQSVSFVADIGVVLMFFFVGLEINTRDIKHDAKESLLVALFNTLIPLISSVIILPHLGIDFSTSVIVGICLAVSSQAVALDFLEEINALKSKIGKLIVTEGAIDDLVEFVLIAIVLVGIHSSVESLSAVDLVRDLVLLLIILWIGQKFLIPWILRVVEVERSTSNMLLAAIIISIAIAVLGDALAIGKLIGAFIAGVLTRHVLLTGKQRRPWEELKISHMIRNIAFGFFVPVFFIIVGFNTDLSQIISEPIFLLTIIAITFIGTIGGSIIGALLSGKSFSEGYILGWGINAKGDTELVIATAALAAKAITPAIFSALIVMSIVATFVSPIVFRHLLMQNKKLVRK